MKESISYSFLLNIVIVFVFTCFAIIMGVLSYYKAFRANTIISETIEKYEGYNCVSAEEIKRKLDGIGYNTPFSVNCNSKGDRCMTDEGQNYAIVSYNLDEGLSNSGLIFKNEKKSTTYEAMNSTYKCDANGCVTNKHYQYGIYTYMYVELPVVSSLIRIPFFSKTSIMYEFRNIYAEDSINKKTKEFDHTIFTDIESVYPGLYNKKKNDKGSIYVSDAYKGQNIDGKTFPSTSELLMNAGFKISTSNNDNFDITRQMALYTLGVEKGDLKTRAITYNMMEQGSFKNYMRFTSSSQMHQCGYITDYSKIY